MRNLNGAQGYRMFLTARSLDKARARADDLAGMELKGFKRLTLEPGERKRVSFTVPVDLLGFATSLTRRIVEPGEFELMIGRSSAEIVFRTTIEVTGKPRELPVKWRMRTDARESHVGG